MMKNREKNLHSLNGDLPASRESLGLGNDHNLAESVTTDATTTFTVFLVPEYY